MTKIKDLISQFDCIGWVPTIRGALSLSLTGIDSPIFGEVDRYSIQFKTYDGSRSHHYIAATSVQSIIDTKLGSPYKSTFRYIFKGEICPPDGDDKQGVLEGVLYVVLIPDGNFSKKESEMLKRFKELRKGCEDYRHDFEIKAESMTCLNESRARMRELWEQLTTDINDSVSFIRQYNQRIIEGVKQLDGCYKNDTFTEEGTQRVFGQIRPLFEMDVALSRDGIVLLKNRSSELCTSIFAEPGTPDDYKTHVPMHRLFKIAMNYVKYLFHCNYHHNEAQDNFLPASNIRAAKDFVEDATPDFDRLFNHQLESFLYPVSLMKRMQFKGYNYTIDCNGVLFYAKSFVNVFRDNGLITPEYADRALTYIGIQEEEFNHLSQFDKSLIKSAIAGKNLFVVVTAVTGLALSLISFFGAFVNYDKMELQLLLFHLKSFVNDPIRYEVSFDESFSLLTPMACMVLLWIGCFVFYKSAYVSINTNRFKFKPQPRSRFWINSNLDDNHLSCQYMKWIQFKTFFEKNRFSIYLVYGIILNLVWIVICFVMIYCIA